MHTLIGHTCWWTFWCIPFINVWLYDILNYIWNVTGVHVLCFNRVYTYISLVTYVLCGCEYVFCTSRSINFNKIRINIRTLRGSTCLSNVDIIFAQYLCFYMHLSSNNVFVLHIMPNHSNISGRFFQCSNINFAE